MLVVYLLLYFVGMVLLAIISVQSDTKQASLSGVSWPQNRKVALVFAHPDDEAMFFVPTLRTLKENDIEVYFICFSNGNYDGLGKVREKELRASAHYFGLSEEQICLVNHPQLPDSPTAKWNEEVIEELLANFLIRHYITKVITFDDFGVSGHCNHIAVSRGVRRLLESRTSCLNAVWSLDSTVMLRKYLGAGDVVVSILLRVARTVARREAVAYSFASPLGNGRRFVAGRSSLTLFSSSVLSVETPATSYFQRISFTG